MKPRTRQRILAIFVFALWQWSCAPQYNPGIEQITQYANLCNAGLPAYCVAMQAVYQQADTNAQIDAEEGIAAHARWQNYWAQQQSNWNSINASNDAAIQATMNRLSTH